MSMFFWSDIVSHVHDGWTLAALIVLVLGALAWRYISLKYKRH
ncbi:MAG TPA: hypothetical protein VGT78_10860 [Rhizomicrobium sp.]|nr:hypothetical protein [Rhizomicrobium sp.]